MHMADALVAPAVAGTMYLCSAVAGGYAIKKNRIEDSGKNIPVMGMMGAFVFATQMINFTIPGTGASGHICGAILLSAIVGPYAGFLTMVGILLVQSLLFADGGILALGCNIWNMAFYGCFLGVLFIWKKIMKNGVTKKKIMIASILGCTLTLQLGALSVVMETFFSGITELPITVFLTVMQPIHLVIGFIEGLITAAILCFVYEARPELLWGIGNKDNNQEGRLSKKRTLLIFGMGTIAIGGGLSFFASTLPDGLEWSVEQVLGAAQLKTSGGIHKIAGVIQDGLAILPDYEFENADAFAGTSIAGIVGSIAVLILCTGGCLVFRFFKKRSLLLDNKFKGEANEKSELGRTWNGKDRTGIYNSSDARGAEL